MDDVVNKFLLRCGNFGGNGHKQTPRNEATFQNNLLPLKCLFHSNGGNRSNHWKPESALKRARDEESERESFKPQRLMRDDRRADRWQFVYWRRILSHFMSKLGPTIGAAWTAMMKVTASNAASSWGTWATLQTLKGRSTRRIGAPTGCLPLLEIPWKAWRMMALFFAKYDNKLSYG